MAGTAFLQAKAGLEAHCQALAQAQLLKIEAKKLYQLADFDALQETHQCQVCTWHPTDCAFPDHQRSTCAFAYVPAGRLCRLACGTTDADTVVLLLYQGKDGLLVVSYRSLVHSGTSLRAAPQSQIPLLLIYEAKDGLLVVSSRS